MKKKNSKSTLIAVWLRLVSAAVCLTAGSLTFQACATTQAVVENTTKTVKRTSRDITRKIVLSDDDLKRKVGILRFANYTNQKNTDFEEIFNAGLPQYLSEKCPGIIVADPQDDKFLEVFREPPRLQSGLIDGYSLSLIGRQFGLNAIVSGSLEDIRLIDELQGLLWTRDTHHLLMVFIRMEVFDPRTATKILDRTFDRRIDIDDLEYRAVKDKGQIELPALRETLQQLMIDVADSICDAVRDQPWSEFITGIENGRYIIPSGSAVGLKTGDILEVYDSGRIIEGIGGERFIVPGLKIGEIEIVSLSENTLEARLVSGEDIKTGSGVKRK